MSEKNVKNEVKEETKETTAVPSEKRGFAFVDPFAETRAKASMPTDDSSNDEPEYVNSSTVKTKVPIFHYVSEDKKSDRRWHNLETSWVQDVHRNGKIEEYPVELRFKPRGNDKYGRSKLFNLVSIICGDEDFVYLEITVSSFKNDSGELVTTYTPRISYTDDDGIEFVCNLSPDTDGDKSNWNLLLSVLKKNGDLE